MVRFLKHRPWVMTRRVALSLCLSMTCVTISLPIDAFARAQAAVISNSDANVLEVTRLVSESRRLDSASQYVAAEVLYREALDLAVQTLGEADPLTGDLLLDLALNQSNQGQIDSADALFRRAEPVIQRSPFSIDRARLAQYQAYHLANQGRYADARAAGQVAGEAWRKLATGAGVDNQLRVADGKAEDRTVEFGELAMNLNFQARMALRSGEIFTAQALASEALELFNATKGLPVHWRASILQALGEISAAQRRTSAAEKYFNSAYDIRKQQFGIGRSTVQTLAELGRAYQADGLDTSAIVTFRQAFAEAKTLRNQDALFNREHLVSFGTAIANYSKRLSTEGQRLGLSAEAFDAFQFNRSATLDQTIVKAQARIREADPRLRALTEELDLTERQFNQARLALVAEQNKPVSEQDPLILQGLRAAVSKHTDNLRAIKQVLLSQYPDFSAKAQSNPLTLQTVRNQLKPGEAIAQFLVGQSGGFVQLIKREGSWIGRVSMGQADLAEQVKTLRRALEVQAGTVIDFDLDRAHGLYSALFQGIEAELTGVHHLIVVPDGALSSLPFSVLVRSKSEPGQYAKADWLVRNTALSHSPSISSFLHLRNSRTGQTPSKLMLAFGDPALLGERAKNGTSTVNTDEVCRTNAPFNANSLLKMAPLPETARELKSIQKLIGTQKTAIFLNKAATESNLRSQNLSDFRIIYFATHGLLPEELKCQAEPGLVLTPPTPQAQRKSEDGLLEASEIATLKLNADLVVLSACNTAGSGQLGGESLSGLAESFFFSGARGLVVSHWQVPSAATERLMTGLFRALFDSENGQSSPALQKSQLALIAQPQTAHPFFWGAFVVVGDGHGVLKP